MLNTEMQFFLLLINLKNIKFFAYYSFQPCVVCDEGIKKE